MLLDSGYFLPPELVESGHIKHGDVKISYEEIESYSRLGPIKLGHERTLMFFNRAKLVQDGTPRLVRPGELILVPRGVTYTVECVDKQATSLLSFS